MGETEGVYTEKIYVRYRKKENSGSWLKVFCIDPFKVPKSKLPLTFGILYLENFA